MPKRGHGRHALRQKMKATAIFAPTPPALLHAFHKNTRFPAYCCRRSFRPSGIRHTSLYASLGPWPPPHVEVAPTRRRGQQTLPASAGTEPRGCNNGEHALPTMSDAAPPRPATSTARADWQHLRSGRHPKRETRVQQIAGATPKPPPKQNSTHLQDTPPHCVANTQHLCARTEAPAELDRRSVSPQE